MALAYAGGGGALSGWDGPPSCGTDGTGPVLDGTGSCGTARWGHGGVVQVGGGGGRRCIAAACGYVCAVLGGSLDA